MEKTQSELTTMRLDKWLAVARIFKHRTDATSAVEGGIIKLNGETVKPAKQVKVGDELTIKIENRYRKCVVKELTMKSLRKSDAKLLYELEALPTPTSDLGELWEIFQQQEASTKNNSTGKLNKKEKRILFKNKYGEYNQ